MTLDSIAPVRAAFLAIALLVLAAGCGGSDDESSQSTTTTASGGCESVDAPDPRDAESLEAPTEKLDPSTSYSLVFATNCGSFTVALDLESAPNTAASLVALAEDGYFDDTIFHRVAPGFVIQGGDPTQSGGGGPGYSTVDAPSSDATYTKGTFAMAKTMDEPPGTAGSQFFVVTAKDAGLPPDYAIAGTVSEGIDTIDRIDALGVADGVPPSQPIVVSSVTVETS
jgi:peptidyl-prolyl cis-trans isomerase B (cyclophilin B)